MVVVIVLLSLMLAVTRNAIFMDSRMYTKKIGSTFGYSSNPIKNQKNTYSQ